MARSTHRLLRKRTDEIASVSFSELLFDLIYVFAVTQLSHYLLHNLTWLGLIQETLLWFAVWLGWQHTTWVTNWFNPNTRAIRTLLFILMIVGLIMSSSIPEAFAYRGIIFAMCYVTIQLGRTICILFILGNNHQLTANFRRIFGWFVISAVFWIWGGLEEGNFRIALWGIGVLIDYTSPMHGFYLPILGRSDPSKEWTIEGHHLIERSQLFVIIAFGETILMTGASLSEFEEWNTPVILAALVSFLSSLAMWWIYFDTSSEAGSEKIRKTENPGWLGFKYHAIHVVLVGALIYCAVGDEMVVNHPHGHISYGAIFTLIVGPIIYLLANMVYKWFTCRIIAVSHMVAIAAFILLAFFTGHMTLLTINAIGVLIFIIVGAYETLQSRKNKRVEE